MHDRYGITEDYLVKEAASVLKGLLEAYPEYKTTPFFRKLVRLPSRALRDSASLGSWWVVISTQRTHTFRVSCSSWSWALL
jgi:hypothetical protein